MQIDQYGMLPLFDRTPAGPSPRDTAEAARELLVWLRCEGLKVEKKWSEDVEGGFRWWPTRNAQTVRIIGGTDTTPGDILVIETDIQSRKPFDPARKSDHYDKTMPHATLSAYMRNPETGRPMLRTLVRTDRTGDRWMRPLLLAAAALQLDDVEDKEKRPAVCPISEEWREGHPVHGHRKRRHGIALVPKMLRRVGSEKVLVGLETIEALRDIHMHVSPCLRTGTYVDTRCINAPPMSPCRDSGAAGVQVSFDLPFGRDRTVSSTIRGYASHREWGAGILLLQKFPINVIDGRDGVRLAWELNAEEAPPHPAGVSIGSWCHRKGTMNHVAFVPNAVSCAEMLPTLLHGMIERVRRMSVRFAGVDWDDELFAFVDSKEGYHAQCAAAEADRKQAEEFTAERYRRLFKEALDDAVDDDDDDCDE